MELPIDFKALLERYIAHVQDMEGTDFIDEWFDAGGADELEWMKETGERLWAQAGERQGFFK